MKNILVMIITVTIGIIFAGSLLAPVIDDVTTTEKTFTNEGYYRATYYDDTTDHTVTWTYEKPNIITVDNEDVTINYAVPNGQVTVVADTDWIVRMYCDAAGDITAIAMVNPTGGTASANVASSQTASVTLTSGSMSATFGTTNRSGTYTDVWLPSNDGDFTMKKSDQLAYIHGDSQIVGYGMSRVTTHSGAPSGSPGIGISLIGTYDDGITATIWRGTTDASISNPEVNAVAENKYVDLYKLDSITADIAYTETIDSETFVTDSVVTYNYILVPYQVTSELSQHLDAGEIAILAAIPLMAIAALVLLVVRYFAAGRD